VTVQASNLGEACSRLACFAPETACVLGQDECEHLAAPLAKTVEANDRERHVLPWSGGSLGLSDLFPIVAVGRPRVVGVVGGPNSGKTTLLAAHWIASRRGMGSFGRAFAGSYSLSGWHQIARHLQWVPTGSGFPPHTSAVDERSPALLHIAVARAAHSPKQILYTDAPGEWFARWADVPAEAPGAQWIADHSDAFVILADGDALSGPDRGVARGNYVALAHQLATAARGRPVISVLTKADIEVPGPVLEQVEELNKRLFGRETMKVSAHNNSFVSITAPIDAGVDAALAARFANLHSDQSAWARQIAPKLRKADQ
jgi:hypothetical protein